MPRFLTQFSTPKNIFSSFSINLQTDNQVKIVHSKGDGLGNSNFNDAERLKNFEDLLSDKPYWGLNREITLDDKDDNLKFRFKDEKQMKSVEISNNMHVFFCAFGRNFKCPLKRVLTTTQFQYLLENVRLWTPEDGNVFYILK